MTTVSRRVQFVITGPFVLLIVLALGLIGGGFWLYTHQPPPLQPPIPPYFLSRTGTVIRQCLQCLDADGQLKDRLLWKLGRIVEIPEEERWWFASVGDRLNLVKIDGVTMLTVHPAVNKEKPWFGFDQRRVFFVVYQDVEARFSIDHPPLPPPPQTQPSAPPSDESSPPPSTPTAAPPPQQEP